nr:MAG TPA: hypothetical protein [Caudoviricetes sp.]
MDFRDWYLPGGGKEKLTTRRLLLIVDKVLDRDRSSFWCAVQGIDKIDYLGLIWCDIFYAVSGNDHPLRDFFYRKESMLKDQEQREKKRSEEKAILSSFIKQDEALKKQKDKE